jgi:hypothetical protein
MDTGGCFLGATQPGREADHSPSSAKVKNTWSYTSSPPTQPGREAFHSPTSADVKNTWIYTSSPPYIFMAYCIII